MVRNGLLLLLLTFVFSFSARAQQTDSLQRATDSLKRSADNLRRVTDSLRVADSIRRANIKIDTNLLNRYRVEPRRNALPQRLRPFQIVPEHIPVTMMDYKVSYWRKSVIFGLNFSQSAFSDNWAGGGVNSFSLNSNIDYKLEYNRQPWSYTTELILLYGRSKNREQLSRKTNDRIFWDNKAASQLSKSWFFFGSLSFESQFDLGYAYDASNTKPPQVISRFMAPGYVTESVGFEYKPNNIFDLRLGTGTARQTLVLDTSVFNGQQSAYGVGRGHTFRNELAFQVVALFDKEIMQNLRLTSRYALFIPYARGLENIDHRLDLTIAAKVNRLISVTITGVALYDKEATDKIYENSSGLKRKGIAIQSNENLAIGILYRFP
ncbi:DUF3078 domain-containing protein [Mucilaginibacter sp. Bleaf8]|uniref:DUF3078 domain-containing protein n=1 Tax=Mucilaginibacter sp. Bleaf8 TaxID=2834430 RepID=UPI001BCBF37F|nr:DUF3078 domain-containing protein [Mucilaginibacter sp. Bleaf8]MBS7565591.1 DUF3078 domain-containing protein [Mucilaginibacter sp. Bleaf8]